MQLRKVHSLGSAMIVAIILLGYKSYSQNIWYVHRQIEVVKQDDVLNTVAMDNIDDSQKKIIFRQRGVPFPLCIIASYSRNNVDLVKCSRAGEEEDIASNIKWAINLDTGSISANAINNDAVLYCLTMKTKSAGTDLTFDLKLEACRPRAKSQRWSFEQGRSNEIESKAYPNHCVTITNGPLLGKYNDSNMWDSYSGKESLAIVPCSRCTPFLHEKSTHVIHHRLFACSEAPPTQVWDIVTTVDQSPSPPYHEKGREINAKSYPLYWSWEIVAHHWDGIGGPDGQTRLPDGRILIANEKSKNSLVVFDPTKKTVSSYACVHDTINSLEEVVVAPDGGIYVSDDSGHAIARVFGEGRKATTEIIWSKNDGLRSPEGFAFRRDGTMIVSDEHLNGIYIIPPGAHKLPRPLFFEGLKNVEGMTVDERDIIYITSDKGDGLWKMEGNVAIPLVVKPLLSRGEGVSWDPITCTIWITDNPQKGEINVPEEVLKEDGTIPPVLHNVNRMNGAIIQQIFVRALKQKDFGGLTILNDGRILVSVSGNQRRDEIWLFTPKYRKVN